MEGETSSKKGILFELKFKTFHYCCCSGGKQSQLSLAIALDWIGWSLAKNKDLVACLGSWLKP